MPIELFFFPDFFTVEYYYFQFLQIYHRPLPREKHDSFYFSMFSQTYIVMSWLLPIYVFYIFSSKMITTRYTQNERSEQLFSKLSAVNFLSFCVPTFSSLFLDATLWAAGGGDGKCFFV